MVTHPTAHYAVHKNNEIQLGYDRDSEFSNYQLLCLYAPHAMAADLLFAEAEGALSWKNLKHAALRLFGKNPKAIELHDQVQEVLGVNLPVEGDAILEMMDEVRRFKWLEAERAGRDIWRERNPSDPEAGATREWFQRHFGAWYLARKRATA